MHKFKQVTLLLISLIALRSVVSAQVTYVSNTSLGGANQDVFTVLTSSFTTGSTAVSIDTLFLPAVTNSWSGTFTASLYEADGTTKVADFSLLSQVAEGATYLDKAGYSFSSSSAIALEASKTYVWTISTNVANGGTFLTYASWRAGAAGIGADGWSIGNTYAFVQEYYSGNPSGYVDFSISNSTASAIPEPSTYAMIAGASMLVGTVIYRRRKAA